MKPGGTCQKNTKPNGACKQKRFASEDEGRLVELRIISSCVLDNLVLDTNLGTILGHKIWTNLGLLGLHILLI